MRAPALGKSIDEKQAATVLRAEIGAHAGLLPGAALVEDGHARRTSSRALTLLTRLKDETPGRRRISF